MNYTTWKEKLNLLIGLKTKNYEYSEEEIEILIDHVYNEILTELSLTFVAQVVKPQIENDRIYDLNCGDIKEFYPDKYSESLLEQVVAVSCVDGSEVTWFMDELSPTKYILNDRGMVRIDKAINNTLKNVRVESGLVFYWHCIPLIETCDIALLNAMTNAITAGVLYNAQDALPNQVDSGVANLSFQRYFNAKKALTNKFATKPQIGRIKFVASLVCEEPYKDDLCNDDSLCRAFNVSDGKNGVVAFKPNNGVDTYYVSGTSGSCLPIPIEVDFGYTCTPATNCPSCVTLMSYNGVDGFDKFLPRVSDSMSVGWEHGGCVDEVITPDYGYTCEPTVDCPGCITFSSYDEIGGFERFVPFASDSLQIGWQHGGCGTTVNPPQPPETGLDCDPEVDCPDCIQYNTFNGIGFDMFVPYLSTEDRLMVGHVYEGCTGVSYPVIDATDDSTIETNQSFTLSASVTGGVQPYAYEWTRDALVESNLESFAIVHDTTGVYTYTITVTDDTSYSTSKDVVVTVEDVVGSTCENFMTRGQDGYEQLLADGNIFYTSITHGSCL